MSKKTQLTVDTQDSDREVAAQLAINPETGELLKPEAKTDGAWPEGFEAYDLSYDNYEAWDWDTHPMLVGKVTNVRTIPMMRKGKQVDVKMLVVNVADTDYALWETAQLKKLMDTAYVNMELAIKFTGMEEIGGGKRLRTFEARTRG